MPPLYSEPEHKPLSIDAVNNAIKRSQAPNIIRRILGIELYIKLKFLGSVRRWPNTNKPERFSDKILHRTLRTNDPRFAPLADKWKVRDYVRERAGDKVLIPLLGVYDLITPSDIKSLDQEYVVLKNSHDCGSSTIVSVQHDNLNEICARLNSNMDKIYGGNTGEYWYRDIQPKIIAEQFIGNDDGSPLSDYRFHVFDQGGGEYRIITSINDHQFSPPKATFYDEDLNVIPMTGDDIPVVQVDNNNFPEFEEMKDIAKKLAHGFDFVRVDLYLAQGKIYFGELTFSPFAGFLRFHPDKYDFWMGGLWKTGPFLADVSG